MQQQQPTQSELRSTLATIIECPICCEMFTTTVRKPKLMTPCGHTLCLECGLTYCRHKSVSNAGERIACPVCRRGVRLPVGGFPALANNLTMMKLLDVRDILIRCDSESEVRSAVDMLEGLLACENKMQCTIDEIEHVRDDIRAVLKRRRRSNSSSATFNQTPSNTEITPPLKSETKPSDTSAVTAGLQRRHLSVSASSPGRSASTGDVLTASSSSTSARSSGTSVRARLNQLAATSLSQRSVSTTRHPRSLAAPPSSPRYSTLQQQPPRSVSSSMRRRSTDSGSHTRTSSRTSTVVPPPVALPTNSNDDDTSDEPLASSWLLAAPPPPLRVTRRVSQTRVGAVQLSGTELINVFEEVLRNMATDGVASARRLHREATDYIRCRSPLESLLLGFFVVLGCFVLRFFWNLFF